jgi:ABC-2 type transport system permease protein
MLTLIKNEIIKLLARRKTLVVLIAFVLFAGIMAFGLYQNEKQAEKWQSKEYRIQRMEESIQHTKDRKENLPEYVKNNPTEIENFKKQMDEQIARMEEELKKLKEEQDKPIDWREDLRNQITSIEKQLQSNTLPETERSNIELRLTQLKYLQEHDINPADNNELNAINFTLLLTKILGFIFLVIGLAIFGSDMVSGECTPPTLKFLLTQPVSRGKVLLSKFIALSTVGTALILLVEVLFFIGVGLIFGFGDLNYPTIVGTMFQYDMSALVQGGSRPLIAVAGSSYLIPVWSYLLRTAGLQAIFIVATTAFIFMLSALFKSSMVSMASSTVILITIIILLQSIGSLRKYAQYIFTSYGDVGELITGGMARTLNNPNVTIGYSILVLAAWTVISYGISHLVFTKKDILI